MKPATDYKKEADFEPAPIRKISGGWQFRPRSYTDPAKSGSGSFFQCLSGLIH